MSELYSRTATLSDMPFIMEEFEEGAKKGHFNELNLAGKEGKMFEKQTRQAIMINEQGGYSGHYIFILVRRSDEKRLGLIWFCPAPDPRGMQRLEIRAISINKAFRGKGYGSILVSDMLDANTHPMMAKCLAKSSQMAEMLKRRGFTLYETLPSGTQILLRDPR